MIPSSQLSTSLNDNMVLQDFAPANKSYLLMALSYVRVVFSAASSSDLKVPNDARRNAETSASVIPCVTQSEQRN